MENKKKDKGVYGVELPEGWEVKRFTDFCELKHGFQFRDEHFVESGIPIIKIGNLVDGGGVREDNLTFIRRETLDQFCKFVLKEGDILMALTGGTLGKVCVFPSKDEAYLQNYRVGNFLPLKNAIKEYIVQLLQSYIVQERILNLVNEAAQPNFGKQDFDKIKVNLPPLPEQRAIAACLSTWDTAIQKTTQLIAQKEMRKKWLMQQLLTGKRRLKGFEGEWKRVSAGEIFKSVSIKGFDSEQLLSATQDKGIIPRSMLEAKVTMPSGETTSFKLVEKGNFVISLRSHQGGLEYSHYRGIVSPAYTVLKSKKKICDEFYKQYFKSYDFIGHLAVAVIGIRDGKQISYEDFCMVKIPYLTTEEQTAIAHILQTADQEIQLLKAKVEKMKEQKKGMMQVLLTGKIRLKY